MFIVFHLQKLTPKKLYVPRNLAKSSKDVSRTLSPATHSFLILVVLSSFSVWLFIDTKKRLVSLHSVLDGSRRDGQTVDTV